MDISIKSVEDEEEMKGALRIRKSVFIEEQGIPEEREMDGLDEEATHFLVEHDGDYIGTARIRIMDEKGKLERISVLKPYRGRGYGRELVKYLTEYCRDRGLSEVVLHSQLRQKDFYEKCGFEPRGEVFLEAGIKHIKMVYKFSDD